jgi:hypothetical protein
MGLFDPKAQGRDSSTLLEIGTSRFAGAESSKQVNLNNSKYFVSNVFTISKKYLIKWCGSAWFDIHKMRYSLQIQQTSSDAVVF